MTTDEAPHESAVELPPQDLHAEQATLGAMLVEPGAATRALAAVSADHFYREAHTVIFKAIGAVHEREEPVDIVTVSAELRRLEKLDAVGGPAYLAALIRETPTAAHVVRYGKIVAEKAALRRLISAGADIGAIGYSNPSDVDAAIDEAERIIFDVAQRHVQRDFRHVARAVKETFDALDARAQAGDGLHGVPTGLSGLDELTGGLQPSDLVIVAGRPSMGKTSLCINNFAVHAAVACGIPVGIFSLEMSKQQLTEAWLCAVGEVDSRRMRRPSRLSDDDWRGIGDAAGTLTDSPIFIDDTPGISLLEMRGKARRLKTEHDVGLIILDYLQLVKAGAGHESRYAEVSHIARSLKGMARELDVPVVAVSQLSRAVERRPEKRPMMSDLADSGNIEAEADLVALLYRPSYYERKGEQVYSGESPDRAELIIAKHRRGPIGPVFLQFIPAWRIFEDEGNARRGREAAGEAPDTSGPDASPAEGES